MGRRATCKKCGAGFIIDRTVAKEVGVAGRELLEQAEENLRKEAIEKALPNNAAGQNHNPIQEPLPARVLSSIASKFFADGTNAYVLMYWCAAFLIVLIAFFAWVSIIWRSGSHAEAKPGPISFEVSHPFEKLGVDEVQWLLVCNNTGTRLLKGDDGDKYRFYTDGQHVAAMAYGDTENLDKIVVTAFARDLLGNQAALETFMKLAKTSVMYVKPGFSPHFERFLNENILKALTDQKYASQVHKMSTIAAMWCSEADGDHLIRIEIVTSFSETDSFEGKR